MEKQKYNPIAIRISIVTNNRPISNSEWLRYNYPFKDIGMVFEISNNGYPSIVMTPYGFTCLDIASWIGGMKESIEKEVYNRLSVVYLQTSHPTLPSLKSMDNVIDLYITPQSGHYYLDSECSNAAVIMVTNRFISPELRDRILQTFKVSTYCNGNMMLIDCGRESHDVVIGRIRRIAALCLFQMGVPANHHLITDKYILNTNDSVPNAICIY